MTCAILHVGRLRGAPTAIDLVPAPRSLALETVLGETHQAQPGSDRWTISGRIVGEFTAGVRGTPLERALYLRDELESMVATVDPTAIHPVLLQIDSGQHIFGRLVSANIEVARPQDGMLTFQIVVDELGAAGHLEHELQIVPLGERPNFRPIENTGSFPWNVVCAVDPNNQSCVNIAWAGGFAALPAESTPQAAYGDVDLLGTSEEFVRQASTIHGPKPLRCWRGWPEQGGPQFLRYHARPESSLDGGVEIWTHGTRRAWETDPQSAGAGLLRCGLRSPGDTHLRDLEICNGVLGVEWRAADPSALWVRSTSNGTTWTPSRRILLTVDGAALAKPTAVTITRNAPDGTTGAIRIDFQHEPASKRYRASLYLVLRRGRRGVDCLVETPANVTFQIQSPGDAMTAWAGSAWLSMTDTAATSGFRHMFHHNLQRTHLADGFRSNTAATRSWFGVSMAIDGGTGAETLANIEHEWVDDCVVTGWAGVPIALTR